MADESAEELRQRLALNDSPVYGKLLLPAMMRQQVVDAMAEDGIVQKELARRLGITQPTVSGVLSGAQAARVETFERWALALEREWFVRLVRRT